MSAHPSTSPCGVHFVGSVPFDSTYETLALLSSTLPKHIKRLPDGEPLVRRNFVLFQHLIFKPFPQLLNGRHVPETASLSGAPFETEEARTAVKRHLETLETGYDTAALESYATFKRLRDEEGVVPQGVRFQVCIPTPSNALSSSIAAAHKVLVEPFYTAALVRAMQNVQASIPHRDLTIQIDCAHEFGILEGIWKSPNEWRFKPWWTSSRPPSEDEVFAGVVDRIVGFAGANHVAPDVELGFHFCYGDIGHKHFIEPQSTALMAKVAQTVLPRLAAEGRRVDYIHLPVPRDRDDEEYLVPLKALLPVLKESGTQLYLGLVREGDEEGTKRRIAAAQKVISSGENGVEFGIATECGMGRTPKDQVGSILDIMKNMSAPVR